MKKSILFITCDEAKHICDRSQYGEASVWEKFKLNVRLSWCAVTRAYSRRNRKLTKVTTKILFAVNIAFNPVFFFWSLS